MSDQSLIGDRGRLFSNRTDLKVAAREHLRALVADWQLLADLSFADLVLWLPTWNDTGFTAEAQVRPNTAPTTLPDDVVGRFVPKGRRNSLDRACASGRIIRGSGGSRHAVPAGAAKAKDGEVAIPVKHNGEVIAVVAQSGTRRPSSGGPLEQAYRECADALTQMITEGAFPPASDNAPGAVPPRVGDGMLQLDARGRVKAASPNANSAFRRLGLTTHLVGSVLTDVVTRVTRSPAPVDVERVRIMKGQIAGSREIEGVDASVSLRTIPLLAGGSHQGALVLTRDVTDLRRQERQLMSKDSTIREIHHRVKNNLQMVAALLRMQARRVEEPVGRAALEEAVRRVGAIAVVHESLSHQDEDDADFDEVVDDVVRLTHDLSGGVAVVRHGSAGRMSARVITPLSMALAELLSNAVQHGSVSLGEDQVDGERRVEVILQRSGRRLTVEVRDDGPGLPPGFDPHTQEGLGIRIVRTLVMEELAGAVSWEPRLPHGTSVIIDILLDALR